jgi:amiloride-sensitive sodium channel
VKSENCERTKVVKMRSQRAGNNGFHRTVKTNFKYQTKEFFSNSTLHGVRYIAEKGRSFNENFMWFCIVAIGAVAAFVIIASLWEKFQTNPTITGNRNNIAQPERHLIFL